MIAEAAFNPISSLATNDAIIVNTKSANSTLKYKLFFICG